MSITGATVAMALPQARADRSDLWRRVASAAVLAPIALAAVWIGGAALTVLAIGAAAIMAGEWARLSAQGERWWGVWALGALAVGAVLMAGFGWYGLAVMVSALGAAALLASGLARREPRLAWLGPGLLYVALPCIALLWLRERPERGLATVLWLFALVWAVDTGAYFAGRAIGGPKLAPRVSPGKTWAGLGGGIAAAVAVGGVAAGFVQGSGGGRLIWISAGLAVLAQAGDLMESAVKRHFKVKDAGTIIPGHGGMLDRVDGLIFILLAVALLTMAAGHTPLQSQ